MKLNQTAKRISCFALSAMLLFGAVTPAFASTATEEKNKVLAEIVASIDTTYANAEDAVKIHLAQAATPAIEAAEVTLAATAGDIDTALLSADAFILTVGSRLNEGCANSEEAIALYGSIVATQEATQLAKETAVANLNAAVANLEAAQKAYNEAEAMSAASKAVVETELEVAKVAVSEAEAVLEVATNKLVALESLLAEAAADVAAWKAEAKNALAVAGAQLEESNARLEESLATFETENAEFFATATEFQSQAETFVASVNTLADKIDDAQTKEAELEALYAEYATLLATYETALAEFSAAVGTDCVSIEDARKVVADLETAKNDAIEACKVAKKNYDNVKAEREALAKFFDQIAVMNEYENEQSKEDVIRDLVKYVIEKKLENGHKVEWNKPDGEYGKSENGFYVVFAGEKIVNRYGYKTTEDGEVKIHEMVGEAPYIITYNDKPYVLETTEDEKTDYITVGDKTLTVVNEVVNGTRKYQVVENREELINLSFEREANTVNPNEGSFVIYSIPANNMPIIKDENGKFHIVYTVEFTIDTFIFGKQTITLVDETSEITIKDNQWKTKVYGKTVEVKPTITKLTYITDAKYVVDPETEEGSVKGKNSGVYYLQNDATGYYIETGVDKTRVDVSVKKDTFNRIEACGYEGEVEYKVNVKGEQGGDEDTVFEPGEDAEITFNNVEYGTLEEYYEAVNAEFKELYNIHEGTKAAKALAEAKYAAAVEAFDNLKLEEKYADFSEKDLGVLAALPKNIEEFITISNIDSLDDITALAEAVTVIASDDNSVDGLKAKVNALGVIATYIPGLADIIPVIDANFVWSVINGNFKETEFGKLVTPGTYQYEYFMAWLDAFTAKVAVVEAGIVVVNEASTTITLGLELVYAGAELSDVTIQTMIEKIKNDVLSQSVAALIIAVDVVEVSDEMLAAISSQVAALRNEVAKAEAELETAVARLAELEYKNPGQAAINEAKARVELATANHTALVEKLALFEVYLTQTEGLKEEAYRQYEELVAFEVPAAGVVTPETGVEVPSEGPVELPTPEVEAPKLDDTETEDIKYAVVFMSEGVVVEKQEVVHGTAAVAPEATPKKEADEHFTYEFAGWDVDFSEVTGDLVVTATFNALPILPDLEEDAPVELPTPEVEYEEPTQAVVVVLPDGTEVSLEVEVGEEEQVPEEFEVDGVAYRFVRWRTILSESGEEIGVVAEYEVVEEPAVQPVAPAPQPSAPVVEEEAPVIYGYYAAPVVEEVVVEEVVVEEIVEDVVETPVVEEIVEIEDEETPLADGAVEIEDEEVPLASNTEEKGMTPVVAAVAGTATVAAAGGAGFFFFKRKRLF